MTDHLLHWSHFFVCLLMFWYVCFSWLYKLSYREGSEAWLPASSLYTLTHAQITAGAVQGTDRHEPLPGLLLCVGFARCTAVVPPPHTGQCYAVPCCLTKAAAAPGLGRRQERRQLKQGWRANSCATPTASFLLRRDGDRVCVCLRPW